MSRRLRLTQEQEEIRLRGLRILARTIVRAHLDSLRGDAGGRGGDCCGDGPDGPGGDVPRKDVEHFR